MTYEVNLQPNVEGTSAQNCVRLVVNTCLNIEIFKNIISIRNDIKVIVYEVKDGDYETISLDTLIDWIIKAEVRTEVKSYLTIETEV